MWEHSGPVTAAVWGVGHWLAGFPNRCFGWCGWVWGLSGKIKVVPGSILTRLYWAALGYNVIMIEFDRCTTSMPRTTSFPVAATTKLCNYPYIHLVAVKVSTSHQVSQQSCVRQYVLIWPLLVVCQYFSFHCQPQARVLPLEAVG